MYFGELYHRDAAQICETLCYFANTDLSTLFVQQDDGAVHAHSHVMVFFLPSRTDLLMCTTLAFGGWLRLALNHAGPQANANS